MRKVIPGINHMGRLCDLIENNEDWLVDRILYYARKHGYVKYSSTLEEAWRKSVAGLSRSLLAALHNNDSAPYLRPEDDYSLDPAASFVVLQAKRHRQRGVTLEMFMGLMKYYRQSYIDLIRQAGFERDYEENCRIFVLRVFDRIEIGFCTEWAKKAESGLMAELQSSNRKMANEKNKYLTAVESLPNPVFILDVDGLVDTMNCAASALFHGSCAPGAYYYNEEKGEKKIPWLADELKAFASGGYPELCVEKEFTDEKGIRHFEVRLSQMLDISGKFYGTVVILNDITERKEFQKCIDSERKRFYSLLEGLPAFIYLQMPDYSICFANRYFRERFGEPGLRRCYEILQRRDRPCVSCPTFLVFSANQPQKWEWELFDGCTYQMHTYPFSDIDGSPMVLVLGIEITEQKRIEETLARSRNFYLSLLEEFPALIWRSGADGKCDYFNKKWLRFTCRDIEQEIGDGWAELVHPEDRYQCLKTFFDAINEQKPFEMEYRLLRHDGEYRWVLNSGRPFHDLNDDFAGYIGVCFDITERREMEREMIRFERMKLVGEMAAGIGHEIRNPMTTVRGFIQLLSGRQECAEYKEWFNLMIEELDRANSIIKEYLSLAKNKMIDLKMLNLNNILKALSPLFAAEAMLSDKNILLMPGDVPDFLLDENEIRQLILNLVRNGMEAMPAGRSLTIKTFLEGKEVVLAVQDQGPGIEPHLLEKLGTPFFTTKDYGTGLGLAVCYSIATRHNATIKVETGGTGTTFLVRFRP